MKELEIRRAREGFIEGRRAQLPLRGIVVDSWQRCQDYGVPVERKGAPLALEAELVQC